MIIISTCRDVFKKCLKMDFLSYRCNLSRIYYKKMMQDFNSDFPNVHEYVTNLVKAAKKEEEVVDLVTIDDDDDIQMIDDDLPNRKRRRVASVDYSENKLKYNILFNGIL